MTDRLQSPDEGLAVWIRENSDVLAMAAIGAYELMPDGNLDLSLNAAADAIVAVLNGERDPLEAVRDALAVERYDRDRWAKHWLVRRQARGQEKILADQR